MMDPHSKIRFLPLLLSVMGWFMSLIIGLVVGYGLVTNFIILPWVPTMVSIVLGWFLIVTTLVASVLWFFDND